MSYFSFKSLDMIEELGEKSTLFTKVTQGPAKDFTDFLQRFGLALNRARSDSETRQSLIEILPSGNGNTDYKREIRPLKA